MSPNMQEKNERQERDSWPQSNTSPRHTLLLPKSSPLTHLCSPYYLPLACCLHFLSFLLPKLVYLFNFFRCFIFNDLYSGGRPLRIVYVTPVLIHRKLTLLQPHTRTLPWNQMGSTVLPQQIAWATIKASVQYFRSFFKALKSVFWPSSLIKAE